MKNILLIVISIYSVLFFTNVSAETGKILEDKSIKEIKQNIEKLHSDRNTLNNKFTVLTKDNNFISYLVKNDYFKSSITKNELINIEILITQYNRNYIKINKQLLDKARNLESIFDEKNKLLSLKKELYQSLITYIKPNKYNQYLIFIKDDVKIIKENLDVK
jgi:molybdopterin converting factor small subunit